jgi:hypothetical protein
VLARPPFVAGAIGALIGLVASAVLVAQWRSEPVVTRGPQAAEAFTEAWERSRLGTYYVRSEVERTTPNGELSSELEVAQRPPDVVRRQHGALWGRQGDRTISCVADENDIVTCGPGGQVLPPFEDEVAEEMARWAAYLEGDQPLYRVSTAGDGCFDLALTQVYPSPPYGTEARFCFDEETGAMITNRIVRDEGTEVLTAVEVRADVTDADFALPA